MGTLPPLVFVTHITLLTQGVEHPSFLSKGVGVTPTSQQPWKYFNRECQITHQKQHRKCIQDSMQEKSCWVAWQSFILREHPPHEDCPICFLPLLLDNITTQFSIHHACGKHICLVVSMQWSKKQVVKVENLAVVRSAFSLMSTADKEDTERTYGKGLWPCISSNGRGDAWRWRYDMSEDCGWEWGSLDVQRKL